MALHTALHLEEYQVIIEKPRFHRKKTLLPQHEAFFFEIPNEALVHVFEMLDSLIEVRM